jgi:hypothetical protein
MFPRILSQELLAKIDRWAELKRWERRDIAQELRRMGLSYREISAVIPVPKGTLSGWCRDLKLTEAQKTRVTSKRVQRRTVGALLRQRALDLAAKLRTDARQEATAYVEDPDWIAGVVAYWAEGAKRHKDLSFSNSDPLLIRVFISWTEKFLGVPRKRLTAKLHLHSGQTEAERIRFWSNATGIPTENFRKTYIKPEGTGHRKNVLYNGTASIRVPCSGALLHRLMGWIDAVAERYAVLS